MKLWLHPKLEHMDTIILFKYLALSLGTYMIIKHIRNSKFNKSILPPSPFIWFPIIGHFYLFKKPLHLSLARLAARHGPVLYLWFGSRPVLLISSAAAAEECLVKGDDVFLDRPRLVAGKYNGFGFTNIAWTPYGPHWRNLRRVAAVEVLSPQRLQSLSGIRSDVVKSFLRWMVHESKEKGVVEMKSAIFRLTLDNMMRMLAGYSNYEEGNGNKEASKKLQNIVEESFKLGGVSNLEDFMPIMKLFRVIFGTAEDKFEKLMKEKIAFMEDLIEDHKQMEKEGRLCEARKKSMLHVLLALQKKDPKYYSHDMIINLIWTLFQGGTDTSSATTVWAISLLINYPEVLKKAQDEIDTNVGYDRLVEEHDKNNLPYIQSIVNETFRMYPPGPLALPYEAKADCQVLGYHVPQGSMLLYNIWAIHNDPNTWDEPRKFKPERYLGEDEGNRLTNTNKLMPFGIGKRVCPGEHLGRRMVWLAVAILVQCFEWDPIGEGLVDMKEGEGQISIKLEPLRVKCHPRPCMMNLLSQLEL